MIRDAAPEDFSAILELNGAAVHFTSAMDLPRLRYEEWHRVGYGNARKCERTSRGREVECNEARSFEVERATH